MSSERGSGKVLPLLVALALLVAGGWAVKTYVLDGGSPKNILLMGVDEDKTRTDVVMLMHIEPRKGVVNVVSLPRDTLVDIDCTGLMKACQTPDKLAHAHAYGGDKGPETTIKTVEHFLGVNVDGYVRVDFAGFAKLVDALGGVDILIDKDMDYDDPTPPDPLHIHFKAKKEPQHLNGTDALRYVRFRNDGLGDIGRTERTRRFMVAVLNTIQKNGKVNSLPDIIRTMGPYVKTNIDAGTAVALAKVAPKVQPDQIQLDMVPGSPLLHKSRGWVWVADEAKTQALVDSLIKHPGVPGPASATAAK